VIVVDASVVLPALADQGHDGERARGRLAGERLVAPALVDLEVLSGLRRARRAGRVGDVRARQVLMDLTALPMGRIGHIPLLARVWSLRDNLSSYDAAYVALAEGLAAPLLTADARLGRAAGVLCDVEVLC